MPFATPAAVTLRERPPRSRASASFADGSEDGGGDDDDGRSKRAGTPRRVFSAATGSQPSIRRESVLEGGGGGWNQTRAVVRSRGVTQAKLKGLSNLAKLGDDEVNHLVASGAEQLQQLETQLHDLRALEVRQTGEAGDFARSRDRKTQLEALVDKLTAMKRFLRFQEECREQEHQFKHLIVSRRAAFQQRLATLETRQMAERNELVQAQQRMANTLARIRAIEITNEHDVNRKRRMAKETEISSQQNRMKQQKEAEFMREIQLCHLRHTSE
ncbi:hypothetical protein HK405_000457, partial [Cladochytrium tenue]